MCSIDHHCVMSAMVALATAAFLTGGIGAAPNGGIDKRLLETSEEYRFRQEGQRISLKSASVA